jgi:hypothetical protein
MGIWQARYPQPEIDRVLKNYAKTKGADVTAIYGRYLQEEVKFAIEVSGTTLMDGDYGNAQLRPMAREL